MKLQTRLLLATGAILTLLTTANLWTSYRAFEVLVDSPTAELSADLANVVQP